MVKKGANIAAVGNVNSTIDILGSNMSTSLDFDDMKRMLTGYTGTRKNVESYQLQGTGTTIDGIYYYEILEEIQKLNKMIINPL